MPRYELSLIVKAMQKAETAVVLKRAVEALLERGAVVRDLQNLGARRLPYNISKHNQRHTHAGYFLVDFHAAPTVVKTLLNQLERDVDVVRTTVLKTDGAASAARCCGPSPSQTRGTSRGQRGGDELPPSDTGLSG